MFDPDSMFENRLSKMFRHFGKIFRKQNISCFRVYDRDIPQFPFCVEIFDVYACVWEYEGKKDYTEEEFRELKNIVSKVCGIKLVDIFIKSRTVQFGLRQYNQLSNQKHEVIVHEGTEKFYVNFTDYLDNGLFLDQRLNRKMLKEHAAGKSVLNLFSYTGSFSVSAAAGGASAVVSVDMSNTYTEWAMRNMSLNGLFNATTQFYSDDVFAWLHQTPFQKFDWIILDPPTFSNSKKMKRTLDIQRDHVELIFLCSKWLSKHGKILFSNNFNKFRLDEVALKEFEILDISKSSIPPDFVGRIKRSCYLLG